MDNHIAHLETHIESLKMRLEEVLQERDRLAERQILLDELVFVARRFVYQPDHPMGQALAALDAHDARQGG